MFSTEINGITFRRGDTLLVEDGNLIATAIIDKIDESNGFPFFKVAVITGERHATGGVNQAFDYDGLGVRHVSTPMTIPGIRCVHIDEGEAGEAALRAHHDLISQQHGPASSERILTPPPAPVKGPPEVVEERTPPATVSGTFQASPPVAAPSPDPADTDQDGTVSDRERRRYDKSHR